MTATSPKARSTASRSPASSAALPSRTVSWMTASACGTPRSSSSAAAKRSGTEASTRTSPSPLASERAARLQERPDAIERRLRLVERRLGDVEARPVVRGGERVAHDERIPLAEHVLGEDEVEQRLRHLLAADGHEAVVHPVPREGIAGRGRLRELVLVVREAQVEPAAVDVELARRGSGATSRSTRCAIPGVPRPTASPRRPTRARRLSRPSRGRSRAGRACRAGRRPRPAPSRPATAA